jgi:peptidyl-prolyl cis-trans isomerase SurA
MARQFSQSASAQQGGDLGWVPEGQLDPELDRALEHMQPGELSPPLRTGGGYYLLLLRDRRSPAAAGDNQVKISRLLLPTPTGMEDRAATDNARRIAQSATGCEDFARIAQQISPTSTMSSLDAKLGDMAPEFRSLIGGLAVGHASDPLPAQNGVQVVMVCERREAAGASLPPRDEVERMLQAEKFEQYSRRLLRDLRQTAFVDIRV